MPPKGQKTPFSSKNVQNSSKIAKSPKGKKKYKIMRKRRKKP